MLAGAQDAAPTAQRYRRRMSRRLLVVLLLSGVVCAGVGAGLLDPLHLDGSRWTAWSPLRIASDNGVYLPVDPVWFEWRPRLGALLLALGAGTSGAGVAALVVLRRVRRAR